MAAPTSEKGQVTGGRTTAPSGRVFRRAMGRFPTGVAVVTQGCGTRTRAVTVNSITSVSLEPMLLSLCLGQDSSILDSALTARHFTVNLLTAGQREQSVRFADHDRPTGLAAQSYLGGRRGTTGSLVIDGALAALECVLTTTVPAGDHVMLIGRVVALHQGPPDAEPLVFYGGSYRQLTAAEPGSP
ncbi:flavin reductase family protein [Streptomyces sp. NPDC001508]|uniref:flavin reductase family protein n=1 Tax=Streptomyces sp. NPDC001508 TaxID=3154656 RepID=UPI0033277B6D